MNCCSQEKETCSLLLSGEGNWCFAVSLFREKGSGAILFSGERN